MGIETIQQFKQNLKENKCPFCKIPLKYYDGCLGYEALKCSCGFYTDIQGFGFIE